MTFRPRWLPLSLLLLAVALVTAQPSFAAPADDGPSTCGKATCSARKSGIDTSMSRGSVVNLPRGPGDDGSALWAPVADGPRYEYGSSTSCTVSPPGQVGADALCSGAVTACSDPAQGAGPLTRIWRRLVQPGQPPGPWQQVGLTCWAQVAPGSRPAVTMAMIQDAFNHTAWAVPRVSTQPVGDVTLVGLDTYYQVHWSVEGFQPGEVDVIDPARMNGYRVDVKVDLDHFVWQFGDGQAFGPTRYEGGVYPTGSITHRYQAGGVYPASVVTTFSGQFRIDGGPWGPIPDTATVPGPATTVTARTAQAQLVTQ